MNTSEPKGLRYNQGKIRWDLQPPDALLEVMRVYTRGATKYPARNWEEGLSWMDCVRALKSHLNKFELGQDMDDEYPELYNMAMVIWNALAILTFQLRKTGVDDRVKVPSTVSEVPQQ